MRHTNSLHLLLPFALAATACGTGTSKSTEPPSLDQPNGGYDTNDEAPQFGDGSLGLAGQGGEDAAPAGDPLASTDARAPAALANADRIVFTAIWGHRHLDRADTAWTDWTGSLSVFGGAIVGARTIAFDRGDHLDPRTSRQAVSWVSHTRPHHDGIHAVIVLRPNAVATASVTLATAPFTVAFAAADLQDFEHVYTVGDEEVVVRAFRVHPGDCATGELRGVWTEADGDGVGHVFGRVFDELGQLRGHLRGRWGTRSDGREVFFAKVIDPAGHFIGRVRGQWSDGHFRGHFQGRAGHQGLVRGRYTDGAEIPPALTSSSALDIGGAFMGRWAESCGRATSFDGRGMPADDQGDATAASQPAAGDETPLVP